MFVCVCLYFHRRHLCTVSLAINSEISEINRWQKYTTEALLEASLAWAVHNRQLSILKHEILKLLDIRSYLILGIQNMELDTGRNSKSGGRLLLVSSVAQLGCMGQTLH